MRFLSVLIPALLAAAPAIAAIDTSPRAARTAVERYYAAIDRGDFRSAYRLWGENGRSGQTYAQFVRGFAQTASTRVVTGAPRDGDAGMGSIWLTIPVDVRARLKDGRRQHFRGEYVMRRVNGVDGATPAQLAWHIDQARLRLVR